MKKLTPRNLRKIERESEAKKKERIEDFLMDQSLIVASDEEQYDPAVHAPKRTAIDPKRLFYKVIGDKRYGTLKKVKDSGSNPDKHSSSVVSLVFHKIIPKVCHHNQ